MVIVKKKTASLFAACCHAGTIIGKHKPTVQTALKEFGLNFGIAFQIIDDCKDIISEERELGKRPGQDVVAGDVTLPLLTLLDVTSRTEREELENMLESRVEKTDLKRIREMFIDSDAILKTQEIVASYINLAKEKLKVLADSDYKESFCKLVDYYTENLFQSCEVNYGKRKNIDCG
jgi:octaprenyl-diphosphate synthase